MFCSNCGKKLEVLDKFCSGCGKSLFDNASNVNVKIEESQNESRYTINGDSIECNGINISLSDLMLKNTFNKIKMIEELQKLTNISLVDSKHVVDEYMSSQTLNINRLAINSDNRNKVISGKYCGEIIIIQNNYAYLSESKQVFSLDTVSECKKVDNKTGNALTGAVLAGAAGAIVASNSMIYVVEVLWKTGEKSLINVVPQVYEKLLASMYNNSVDLKTILENEIKYNQKDSVRSSFLGGIILISIIVIIICNIILLIG